uniref:Secretogranin-1 n=1 Tax=Meleagris gallopavo TaxID=9103 RepID=A0A803Y8G5_MELGA
HWLFTLITRCIVEVLANALSKPSAPPINPECKEILKKGPKEKTDSGNLEVRHLKEPSELENPHSENVEREQSQAEGDSKKRMEGSDEEKLHPGEGNSKEDEEGHHIPENSYHSEEEGKESKQSDGEVDHAVLNKKSHSAGMSTEEVTEENDQRPMDHWHSEEGMQSPYKGTHEGEEEEAEEERSEKYHLSESKGHDFSQRNEQEESHENEEVEEEKKSYKPKRYHGKHRMGDSSEENRGLGGEKEELAEESNVEESHLWGKRNNRQKHHHGESEQQHEEKSGYRGRHGSEGMEEKRRVGQGSVEHRERWQQNEEKSQEENKRHHNSEESNEKWHEEGRHHSEGRAYRGDESEEELDRYHSDSSKEKQQHAGGRYHLWDDEGEGTLKAYTQEHKGQARTRYNTEDNIEQSHLPAENEKRTTASYSSLYPLLWWKSRHFEKRNSAGERLPESKEESRPTLSEKNLFPEYGDYDWWDKKQLLSALNRGRSEKRNLSKRNRYDMKRQYDKMDQLAQLLNYRKKSAEFLELYNSGEDMKKRHVIRNDKGTLNQRPLTEEEPDLYQLKNVAVLE